MKLEQNEFLKDVKNHQIEIIRDNGNNRHIRFKQPNTNNMYFDLVTWDGYLVFTGDMGSYMFTRVRDMFSFFRSDLSETDDRLLIDRRYWGEKCVAVDKNSPIEVYSQEKFKNAINEYLDSVNASQEIRDRVYDDVISQSDDNEYFAMQAAIDFEHDGFMFHDFWETNVYEYSYMFTWCCYAIVWGIREYDKTVQNHVLSVSH